MKTEIKTEKIEIVRQVKLTGNQRLTLVAMSNNGGRMKSIDYGLRNDLLALGLIEEHPYRTPAEAKAAEVNLRKLWALAPSLARAKDSRGLKALVSKIEVIEWDAEVKGYWLTKAATEYLVKGKVTIVR